MLLRFCLLFSGVKLTIILVAYFQVPLLPRFSVFSASDMQMFPVTYPAVISGINSEDQDQSNRGAGIYAVPVGPYMRPVAGLQSNTLIPLTYNVPT